MPLARCVHGGAGKRHAHRRALRDPQADRMGTRTARRPEQRRRRQACKWMGLDGQHPVLRDRGRVRPEDRIRRRLPGRPARDRGLHGVAAAERARPVDRGRLDAGGVARKPIGRSSHNRGPGDRRARRAGGQGHRVRRRARVHRGPVETRRLRADHDGRERTVLARRLRGRASRGRRALEDGNADRNTASGHLPSVERDHGRRGHGRARSRRRQTRCGRHSGCFCPIGRDGIGCRIRRPAARGRVGRTDQRRLARPDRERDDRRVGCIHAAGGALTAATRSGSMVRLEPEPPGPSKWLSRTSISQGLLRPCAS